MKDHEKFLMQKMHEKATGEKTIIFETKETNLFFSFFHKNGLCRSFPYNGILDMKLLDAKNAIEINHTSTRIIIIGAGLQKLFNSLIDLKAYKIYEEASYQDKNGEIEAIIEIMYSGGKEAEKHKAE